MADSFSRRSFLAAFAAGLVLDPERLLWKPGKKLISIPKPSLDISEREWITVHEIWVRYQGQVLYYLEGELIQIWPEALAPVSFVAPNFDHPWGRLVEREEARNRYSAEPAAASPLVSVAAPQPRIASAASRNPPLRPRHSEYYVSPRAREGA